MEETLSRLNPAQREAVELIDGPILILAGAGTGKTTTITTRLAYLLANGIDPTSTLTLTFTNKAATEMRERAMRMLDDIEADVLYPPKLFTFHKFGLLFLKFHIDKLGRKNSFVVIDTDDKKRIIKQFCGDLPPNLVAAEISHFKNSLVSPDEAKEETAAENVDKRYREIAGVYEQYQNYLETNNLVDFDDLLALPYKILEMDDQLCRETSDRYKYIMVDEYQDTNELQFRLLGKLLRSHKNLCVVGDDDQSIYGWRGANVKNILDFEEHFDGTRIVKLEENYRSTNQILSAANELITHNRSRHGKTLRSTRQEGNEVEYIESRDETEEAVIIGKRVRKLIDSGEDPSQIAVLFRINALSRSIEEGLNKAGVPYKLLDSVRFYERTEVKDGISYLRLVINEHDDFSLKRVINKPKRGIGKATVDKLEKAADEQRTTLFGLLENGDEATLKELAGKKNAATLKQFVDDLRSLQETAAAEPYRFIDELEEVVGLRKFYESANEESRVLNVDELYGVLRDYLKQHPEHGIEDFLNELALQSDQDTMEQEAINLMTIHASKGLEFKHVFVVGLEDGFFPLLGDGTDLEEERRLGYVALTRAKDELVLSSVKSRFFRGKRKEMQRSRFLSEAGVIKGSLNLEKTTKYKKGDLVKHKIFGMGRVTGVSKVGREFKLGINFGGTQREILASFVEKI